MNTRGTRFDPRRIGMALLIMAIVARGTSAQPQSNNASGLSNWTDPPVIRPFDGEKRHEDHERVERYWHRALSPNQYRRAVAMSAGLSRKATPSGVAAGPWLPTGPEGGFTEGGFPDRNGRMTGIHIRNVDGHNLYYVGACGGGLWAALDGPSWVSWGKNLPNPSVRAFAVNPIDTNDVIVGTGDWKRYPGSGMYRTFDAGASWVPVPLPIDPKSFFRIHYVPGTDIVVAACGTDSDWREGGILRSPDGGVTWAFAEMATPPPDLECEVHPFTGPELRGAATDLVIDPSDATIMYACITHPWRSWAGEGVWKSTDTGATWSMLSHTALPRCSEFDRASIAICRDSPLDIAVLVENGNLVRGVFLSPDGGTNWDGWDGTTSGISGVGGGQMGHAQAIAFRPNNPDEIYVGSGGLTVTTNGGKNWNQTWEESTTGHADITQLYFSEVTGDDTLWILNDGGIYRRDLVSGVTSSWNGGTTSGLRCSQIDFMDAESDMRTIGLQDNGSVRSINSGLGWTGFKNADGFDNEITDHLAFDFWYAAGIFSPAPAGRVFKVFSGFLQSWTANVDSTTRLFYDRINDRMLTTAAGRISSTPVSGPPNWTVQQNVAEPGVRGTFGSELTGDTLYLTHWGAGGERRLTVCESSVGGWACNTRQVAPDDTGRTQLVETIYVSREHNRELWAGMTGRPQSAKVLHTTDNWSTWEDISGNLSDTDSGVGAVESIVVSPFDRKTIFAGTDVGVYVTTNGGISWTPFQDGLPFVRCTDLRYLVDPTGSSGHRLVVSTYGHGVYERALAGPAIAYVDGRNSLGPEDGTFEHPFDTFVEGLVITAPGHTLALHAGHYSQAPITIDTEMTIQSYGGTVTIGD